MIKKLIPMVAMLALIALLLSGLPPQSAEANPDWWDTDWQYRMKLTFDNSASGENLTNFPVLVHLTSTHTGFWTNINSSITTDDTKDLRFVDDDDTTELYFEAEKIDYASQDALIWVKVPQIDAGSTDDFIYLYYGSSQGESSYHSPSNVWDSNFMMVQHLQEGSGSTAGDSTANSNDGIIYGAMGKAESGTNNTLTDSDQSWATDEWAGETIEIARGTGSGQTRTVASNTATVITVSSDWATNPDATSEYRVTSDHEWTTSGKFDNAIDFDEVDDLIRVPDSASLDGTNDAGTFELWIWWDNAVDGYHQIVMSSSNRFTPGFQNGYEWASQGDGDHFFYPWGGDGNNYNLGLNPFTNQTWQYLVVTLLKDNGGGEGEVKIYVDTVSMSFTIENVPTLWTTLASPDDWLWGGNPDRYLPPDVRTRYFDGMFDEIRVSDTVRSEDWLEAQYLSMTDAFITFGSEEEVPRPPGVGGEVYPVNKVSVLAPWLGLILILAIGAGIFALTRRRAH